MAVLAPDPTHGIVLFDGTCAFCERSVVFMARRDPGAYLRFGASQTPQAEALLARHGIQATLVDDAFVNYRPIPAADAKPA